MSIFVTKTSKSILQVETNFSEDKSQIRRIRLKIIEVSTIANFQINFLRQECIDFIRIFISTSNQLLYFVEN